MNGQHETTPEKTPSAKRARRRAIKWMLWSLALIVAAPLLWLGVRAYIAYDAFVNVEGGLRSVQRAVGSNNFEALPYIYREVRDDARRAHELTSDPVWLAAENLPVLGENLGVVRQIATVVSELVDDGIGPIAKEMEDWSFDQFRPHDGAVELEPILRFAGALEKTTDAVLRARASVAAIDASNAVAPVGNAVARIENLLGTAASMLASADRALELIPPALGAEGPRTYLLVVQDNSRDRFNGGALSVLVEFTVVDGRIALGEAIPAPESIAGATSSVAFADVASELVRWWQSRGEERVDAVISIDFVGLASLIGATGPVELDSGEQLDQDSAAGFLAMELYEEVPDALDRDAVRIDAVTATIEAVLAGDGETGRYLDAAVAMRNERRIQLWSENAAEQILIETIGLHGGMPELDEPSTAMGIFLDQSSNGPLSPYVAARIEANSAVCAPDEVRSTELSLALESTLTRAIVDSLPPAVRNSPAASAGVVEYEIAVYSPVGAVDASMTVDGRAVDGTVVETASGRLVLQARVRLEPGETRVVETEFSGGRAEATPLDLRTTPRLESTPVFATSDCG